MNITAIRNADWAIVWDETAGCHVCKRGIDVVFNGDTLTYVGGRYEARSTPRSKATTEW